MMHDRAALLIVLCTASLFCAWNLYWGLRDRRTWVLGLFSIERRRSPWNYWAAIAGWTIFTAGFLAALIAEAAGISLVHMK